MCYVRFFAIVSAGRNVFCSSFQYSASFLIQVVCFFVEKCWQTVQVICLICWSVLGSSSLQLFDFLLVLQAFQFSCLNCLTVLASLSIVLSGLSVFCVVFVIDLSGLGVYCAVFAIV